MVVVVQLSFCYPFFVWILFLADFKVANFRILLLDIIIGACDLYWKLVDGPLKSGLYKRFPFSCRNNVGLQIMIRTIFFFFFLVIIRTIFLKTIFSSMFVQQTDLISLQKLI